MQYFDQLDPKLAGALLGNVGNLIVFRVGVRDASLLAKERYPVFQQEDLVSVPSIGRMCGR